MPNWKKVIVSGSDAALRTLNVTTAFTASGLNYPTTDNGEESFLQTNGSGILSFQYVKTIYEEIYNGEATQIVKGTPLYVSGAVGAASVVYRADAGNASKMPVIYISADNIASGATGRGIALGLITGVNTTGYLAGTEIYVAVGGGWTSTRPTGSAIVQTLGYVTKEGAGGQGVILNPGPNSLPNLPSGSVWVGNSSSIPTSVLTSSLSVASASFASTSSFLNSTTNAFIQNGNSFGTQALLGTNDNQNLALETSGSIRMFISSSGNVGIGTNSPTQRLHVNGNILLEGGNSIFFRDTGTSIWEGSGLNISSGTSRVLNLISGGTTRLRIDTTGNVGIGTTTPGDRLQVVGGGVTAQSINAIGPPSVFTGTGGIIMSYASNVGTIRAYSNSNGTGTPAINFLTSGSERVRITGVGDVGIGTTSPNSKLDVNGNTTITGSLAVSQSLLQYSNITSVTSGSTSNVASFNTSSYTAAFFDYVTTSGTSARAGSVFTVWNGNNVEYAETSTNDIGNTNNLVLSASLSAGAIRLQATSLSGSWSVKTLARMI